MSGNNNNQTPDDIRKNTQERIAQLAAELQKIDETEGAKANELLNLYSALHVDPSEDTKDAEGRTAAEVYAEYEKVSAGIAERKAPLVQQLNDFSKGLGLVADYETLRRLSKERAAASQAACQEPFRDYTEFTNPQLDKIRSDLQKNPLPGGPQASIDDGTGGEPSSQQTTPSQPTEQ